MDIILENNKNTTDIIFIQEPLDTSSNIFPVTLTP